jgi:hypothetical protein
MQLGQQLQGFTIPPTSWFSFPLHPNDKHVLLHFSPEIMLPCLNSGLSVVLSLRSYVISSSNHNVFTQLLCWSVLFQYLTTISSIRRLYYYLSMDRSPEVSHLLDRAVGNRDRQPDFEDTSRRNPRSNAATGASAAGVRALSAQLVAFYFRVPVKAFFRTRVE